MFTSEIFSRRRCLAAMLATALVALPVRVGASDSPCCQDITGRWTCGHWKSFCTGHHGQLRANIVQCGPCHYKCTFSGTFFGLVPFRYTATLTVTGRGDGVVHFKSSRNIPLFGGTFSMCGHATSCKLTANYKSDKDRGVFVLSR